MRVLNQLAKKVPKINFIFGSCVCVAPMEEKNFFFLSGVTLFTKKKTKFLAVPSQPIVLPFFYRTIEHVSCTFNLPTQYNAPGQENIKDDEEKIKVKLDPKKVQVDELTQIQLEEIATGWVKYLNQAIKVNTDAVSPIFFSFFLNQNLNR